MNIIDEPLIKGNSADLEATLGGDITNWKIRAEIYDDSGQCIQLATANSGGSDEQIEITNSTNGEFTIKILKNKTTNFCDKGFIEIEVETDDAPSKLITIAKDDIEFVDKKITWTDPS